MLRRICLIAVLLLPLSPATSLPVAPPGPYVYRYYSVYYAPRYPYYFDPYRGWYYPPYYGPYALPRVYLQPMPYPVYVPPNQASPMLPSLAIPSTSN
jgi:hypothetical protein